MELSPGTKIGSYEIRHKLGAGGMGEVYFARDTKLGRHVALKLLLPDITSDEDRLRRFGQEARATSALNHPNILTIYEIGQSDSLHYIVTEFIEGVTLREHLAAQPIPTAEVLDLATQVAAALAAAHASGIVHRDIKPENIMLRVDGYVKVLDFGLAKLVPSKDPRLADPNASTAPNVNTDPGAVVGTVVYMSPEQLRGSKVDGRADIWSLGVVMFEMLAGRPPFSGSTKSDIIASILREEPPHLVRYAPDVPPDLQRIISKTLRKNREERYQIAKDLLIDLKDLKQEFEIGAKLERIQSSQSSEIATAAPAAPLTAETEKATDTAPVEAPRPTSGVDLLFSEIKQHRVGMTVLLATLLLLIGGGAIWLSVSRQKSTIQNAAAPKVSEIMTTSNVKEAAISPDGKFIATIVEDAGRQSIRLQQSTNAIGSPIVSEADGDYRGVVFSRDGYSIYYLAREEKGSALYQVPVLGGAARKLISAVDTPVATSPDGTQVAFVRRKANGTVLVTAKADGTGERELATVAGQSEFGTFVNSNNGPAWSPDGKVIACPTMSTDEPFRMDVIAVRVEDGSLRPIGSQHWFFVGQLGWLSDGSGLVMTAQEKTPPLSMLQVWFIGYPAGEAHPLTSDLGDYQGISMTADANTLITRRTAQTSNLWIISDFQTNQASEIPASKNKGSGGITWTPDGNIVYASTESGSQEIWTMEASGDNAKQLTFDKHTNVEPAVPRSNFSHLVFASYATGQSHICRTDNSGANLRQLTSGSYEDWPDCSPDDQWVIYHSEDSSNDRIAKIAIDGGQTMLLSDKPARHPVFSPDGKLVACFLRDETSPWRLAILSFAGGPPLKTFALPVSVAEQWPGPRWTADGQAITYILTRGGVSNIWIQPLTGEPARQLTSFSEDQIFAFAWSPDGKKLACLRGVIAKSVILMKDFKK